MVIKLPRSRESTPVAVTPPSTPLGRCSASTQQLGRCHIEGASSAGGEVWVAVVRRSNARRFCSQIWDVALAPRTDTHYGVDKGPNAARIREQETPLTTHGSTPLNNPSQPSLRLCDPSIRVSLCSMSVSLCVPSPAPLRPSFTNFLPVRK